MPPVQRQPRDSPACARRVGGTGLRQGCGYPRLVRHRASRTERAHGVHRPRRPPGIRHIGTRIGLQHARTEPRRSRGAESAARSGRARARTSPADGRRPAGLAAGCRRGMARARYSRSELRAGVAVPEFPRARYRPGSRGLRRRRHPRRHPRSGPAARAGGYVLAAGQSRHLGPVRQADRDLGRHVPWRPIPVQRVCQCRSETSAVNDNPAVSETGAVNDSPALNAYRPSPRPVFDRATALRRAEVTRHVWGDTASGEVLDWIYVSSSLIHQIVFGLPVGSSFRHSDAFRTIFAADEVLHVLSGTMILSNPATGEAQRVNAGEAAFFRRDTWHHAHAVGTDPLRVLEIFAPPPTAGTSGSYARTKELLTDVRLADDALLGRLATNELAAPGPNSMRVIRPADLRWRLEPGRPGPLPVGLVASTEHLTVAVGELYAGQSGRASCR